MSLRRSELRRTSMKAEGGGDFNLPGPLPTAPPSSDVKGVPTLIRLPHLPLPPGPDSLRLEREWAGAPAGLGAGRSVGWPRTRRPGGTDLQVRGPGPSSCPSPSSSPSLSGNPCCLPPPGLLSPGGRPKLGRDPGWPSTARPRGESPTLGSEPPPRRCPWHGGGEAQASSPVSMLFPLVHARPSPSTPRLSPDV